MILIATIFGFDNLYVCDASVFPTALGVNPQLTVMALATITANKIIQKWKIVSIPENLGNICDSSQPRYCKAEQLSEQFSVIKHKENLFTKLVNSEEDKRIIGKNWKLDTKTLRIYNDVYWKGFYGRDNDMMTTLLRYFGGFYKRFRYVNGNMEGITHPFEAQIVNAKSIASEVYVPGYGKVIYLKYKDLPYSMAYDLLKMIDENTIIGKAFLGPFGKGRELFSFSMSRTYDVDFLTEDDLLEIFNSDQLSNLPTQEELIGSWEGMLVSDSSVSPRSQIFYFNCEDGIIDMKYTFANLLSGYSDSTLKDRILRLDDQTPLHDEIRIVTPNLAVGLWVTDWSSNDVIKPILEDLRRYLPVKISTNDIFLKNALATGTFASFWGQTAKGIRGKFSTCRRKSKIWHKNWSCIHFKENILNY